MCGRRLRARSSCSKQVQPLGERTEETKNSARPSSTSHSTLSPCNGRLTPGDKIKIIFPPRPRHPKVSQTEAACTDTGDKHNVTQTKNKRGNNTTDEAQQQRNNKQTIKRKIREQKYERTLGSSCKVAVALPEQPSRSFDRLLVAILAVLIAADALATPLGLASASIRLASSLSHGCAVDPPFRR